MKMIVPKIPTYDQFSTNLNDSTEDEYDYSGATTYTMGDLVKISFESDGVTRIFPENLQKALASSTDDYPPDSSDWSSQGAVNRHKMFDQYINTQAVADGTEATDAGDIVLTLDASRTNGIALFSVEGSTVTYELYEGTIASPGDLISTFTDSDIRNRFVESWYGYFYTEFPSYNDLIYYYDIRLISIIKITITDAIVGSYPKVGACVFGQSIECGVSQFGARPGFMDFSKISRDSFGNVSASQGNYAKLVDIPVRIDKTRLDTVQNAAINVRGLLTVFDGNNDSTDYGSFRVLGLLTDFRPVYESFNEISCTFKIEGAV